MSLENLSDVLERYEGRLTELSAPVLGLLRRPLRDTAALQQALVDSVGHAPQELLTWFNWQDGLTVPPMTGDFRQTFAGAWRPLALAESLSLAATYRRNAAKGHDPSLYWGDSLLPLVAMEGGRTIAADASAGPDLVNVYFHYTYEGLNLIGSSLTGLVNAWIQLIDSGMIWEPESEKWGLIDGSTITPELSRSAGY